MNTILATALLTHSLVWALLNSLWQGGIVYGAFRMVLLALEGIAARAKYLISLAALAKIVLLFAGTWAGKYERSSDDAASYTTIKTHTASDAAHGISTVVNTDGSLESNGLLSRTQGYVIRKNGDELSINGKKQPEYVYEEYESSLPCQKVTIKGDRKHMTISMRTQKTE